VGINYLYQRHPVSSFMSEPARSESEAADGLREQAASCRKLAGRARTASGSTALKKVADQFDDDARLIDPLSERR
jgi:hypothetical protein